MAADLRVRARVQARCWLMDELSDARFDAEADLIALVAESHEAGVTISEAETEG